MTHTYSLTEYEDFESFCSSQKHSIILSEHLGSRIYLSQCAEEEWIYKIMRPLPSITYKGNVLGVVLFEILCEVLGYPSLKSELYYLRRNQRWIIRQPFLASLSRGNGWRPAGSLPRQCLCRLDSIELWRIFVLDILTGNADRSLNNLLVTSEGHGGSIYPIDNELSFLSRFVAYPSSIYYNFVRKVSIQCADSSSLPYGIQVSLRQGSVHSISCANPIYADFFSRLKDSKQFRRELLLSSILPLSPLRINSFNEAMSSLPRLLFPSSMELVLELVRSTLHCRLLGLAGLMSA